MHPDVVDLEEFYARPLGAVVRRLLGHRLRARWRDVRGMRVFGIGFASPYLGAFRCDGALVGSLMPAEQGFVRWPGDGPSHVALVEEHRLPLGDAVADRIVTVHGLETTDNVRATLAELWRVLAANGRLLLIVPNRRGLWARFDTTPFGQGQPYSRGQLTRLLKDARFTPTSWTHALYMPPFNWPVLLRSALAWERFGAVMWPAFSGVLIIEATKQVYARIPREAETASARLQPAPATAVTTRSAGATLACAAQTARSR